MVVHYRHPDCGVKLSHVTFWLRKKKFEDLAPNASVGMWCIRCGPWTTTKAQLRRLLS